MVKWAVIFSFSLNNLQVHVKRLLKRAVAENTLTKILQLLFFSLNHARNYWHPLSFLVSWTFLSHLDQCKTPFFIKVCHTVGEGAMPSPLLILKKPLLFSSCKEPYYPPSSTFPNPLTQGKIYKSQAAVLSSWAACVHVVSQYETFQSLKVYIPSKNGHNIQK